VTNLLLKINVSIITLPYNGFLLQQLRLPKG